MYHDTPIEHIARSWHRALYTDLPKATGKAEAFSHDVELIVFLQGWGDTSLMFTGRGGLAGQAMSSAYTVVVTDHRHWLVYCAGSFAYYVSAVNNPKWRNFANDLQTRTLADQRQALKLYDAKMSVPSP